MSGYESDTCERSYTIRIRYVWTQIFLYPHKEICGHKNLRKRVDGALEHSRFFFFLCACILWNVISWKTNRSLKKSEVYSFIFFQLLEFKQLQRRRQQQSHLTKASHARSFSFFCTYIRFFMQNNRKSNNLKIQGFENTNV